MSAGIRGLYAITPCDADGRARLEFVEAVLRGGARVLQYRDKTTDHARRSGEAAGLRSLCRDYAARLIINDDVALAKEVGAHGVHLGDDDGSLERAREILGPDCLIGASCYNRLDRAEAAVAAGADYVAFGRFFVSTTKPDAVAAPPALLAEARERLRVPIVAIGGITADNGAALCQAGADALAVINGVFALADPEAAARRIAALFAP